MKRFFYLLIFTFIYPSLTAQNINYETTLRSHFYGRPMEMIPINDYTIVASGDGGCHYPYTDESLRIDILDESGDLFLSFNYADLMTNYCIENVNIVQGTDNSIYAHIYGFDCDFGLSLLIVKFFSDGYIDWVKTNDELPISYYGNESIKAAPDGGLWVLTTQGLVRLDANGDIAQAIPHPQGSSGIAAFNYKLSTNELVYFQRIGSEYELVYTDGNGSTQTTPWSNFATDVYLVGNNIFIKRWSTLSLLDKQGNVLNPMFGLSSAKILEVSDQYIYTYNSSDSTLTKMDDNFNITNQSKWEFGDIKHIAEREDYLTILGEELDHIYVKTIGTDFSYNSENTDIGLVDIMLDTTYITPNGDCPSYPTNSNIYKYHVTGLQVVIQNFGTVPISYCEINARYYTPCESFWCNIYWTHYRGYAFPPIMPGETYTLSLPDLYLDSLRSNAVFELYTTSPNHKIDKDGSNNEYHRDFLTSVSSVQNQLPFIIFPTLATDIIHIESDEITNWQKASIKIITTDGQQIDAKAPQIDVSSLPAGMYILHCEYDGLSGSQRFVKY